MPVTSALTPTTRRGYARSFQALQAWSRSGKGAWFFFRTKAEVRPCPLGRLLETGGGLVYSVRLSERRPLTTSRQLVGAPSLRRPPPPPPIYRSRSSFFSFSSRRRTTLVDDADSRPRHLRHCFPLFFFPPVPLALRSGLAVTRGRIVCA